MAVRPQICGDAAGQLAVILSADDGLPQCEIAIGLARAFANAGESLLLLDCGDGGAVNALNINVKATLHDVMLDRATLRDAKHITPCGLFSVSCAGQANLDDLLGTLAAMSLSYDRIIVITPPGCTPAHIRLTCAADQTTLIFDGASDRFMRGFWMMDAIRTRAPKCDPDITVIGDPDQAQDAYDMFAETVRDYLGAPPPLAMICQSGSDFDTVGQSLANQIGFSSDGSTRVQLAQSV